MAHVDVHATKCAYAHKHKSFVTHVDIYNKCTHAKCLLDLYRNSVEVMQTSTYKDILSYVLLFFYYCKKKTHTLSPAFSFPHTLTINPQSQQYMFIFHCSEFTLGVALF